MSNQPTDDLAYLEEWVNACRSRGWQVPANIIENPSGYLSQFGRPEYCASCGVPVLNEDYWTGAANEAPFGHPTWDWERLCDECNDGDPGHTEYHISIEQTERERHYSYVPGLPRNERRWAHEAFEQIAQKEHRNCPWAARGEYCEHTIDLHVEADPEDFADEECERTCQLIIPDFKAINDELIEYFATHPDRLHDLEWRHFEELLAAVFRNQGFDTELGPGRGDGGVDLRLVYKDGIGELLTLVQAKKYAKHRPIELEAVAALSALVDQHKANRGIMVTTSRFLPVAQRFAEPQGRRLILATSKDVADWCKEIAKRRRTKR